MADQDGAPAAEDTRQTFKLNRADSASFRAALTSGEPDRLDRFWDGLADQMAFVRESIVTGEIPDKGLIEFRATPIAAKVEAELAEEPEDEPAPSPDSEAQMAGSEQRAIEAIDQFLAGAEAATLAGDTVAGILNAFQAIHKPWDQHSQLEKRQRVAQLESLTTQLLRGLVAVLAGEGRVSVKAMVDKITIGDKVAISLKLAAAPHEEQGEAIAQLFDWKDSAVLIVSADANGFLGRRAELVPPDEIELPFDEGDPPAEAEADADESEAGEPDPDDEPEDEESEQASEFDAGDEELAGN